VPQPGAAPASSEQTTEAAAGRPAAGIAEDARLAAALLLVDPIGLGGVRLRAQAGPVREAWLQCLRELMPAQMQMCRVPVQCAEDRLLGGLDLTATLAAGKPVAQQGLLVSADGGLLCLQMAERLPDAAAAQICAAMDRGAVALARDGISALLPTRFAVLAMDEALPEDTALSPALADRLGLWVDLRELSWRDSLPCDAEWVSAVKEARQRLPEVRVSDELVQALCAATLALGVDSARAAWQAQRLARASAALFGRDQALSEDAALAARLVLGPRATRQPLPAPSQEDPEQAEAEPPEPPEVQEPEAPVGQDPLADDASEPPPPPTGEASGAAPDQPEQPPPDSPQPLDEMVLEAAKAAMPAGLLAGLARLAEGDRARGAAPAAGRAGAVAMARNRGRPLGARPGAPNAGARLHLIATLRAAAPWQAVRKKAQLLAQSQPGMQPLEKGLLTQDGDLQPFAKLRVKVPLNVPVNVPVKVFIRPQDFHIRRFQQRRGTTTIFAIDASGSAALQRLAEAKGAVELLLAECYVRRDEVAVISFRGQQAELLLPPTRSLVRAKRSLAAMPGGGGTPLASGIEAAARLLLQVRRTGATPVVVLLTDGRANVSRDGLGGRQRAQEDAIAAARHLRSLGAQVLLIDTSARPEPAALALSLAMGARYLVLPQADARSLSRAVQPQARRAA